jgi:hypothetical protein
VIHTEYPSGNRPAVATGGDPPMISPDGPGPDESVRGVGRAQAVVQTAEGTAVAQEKQVLTATVQRLLTAYADTLDVLGGLPVIPMVATRWHWWSRPNSPIRLPRISWMLRSLTLWHIDRVLSRAEREFRRRLALGVAEAGEAGALDAVIHFRASLPSRSMASRFGMLAVAVLVLARVLVALLVQLIRPYARPGPHAPRSEHISPLAHWLNLVSGNVSQLLANMLGTLQPTAGSAGGVLDALSKASPAVLASAAGLLTVSLYLILWPVARGFRLKRLLLNLYPQADRKLRTVPAAWSMTRSAGVYDLERETFAALGARVPGEPPLDLLVSLPLPICWIALFVYDAALSTVPSPGLLVVLIPASIVLTYILPAAIRLAWLAAAWRARNGHPRSAWLFGDEVSVPWRAKPVRCRSPLLIGWLSLMTLCMPIIWWLWWSTARDLRQLGRTYGVEQLRRMHPAAQAFAVGPGALLYLPALIVLSRAPRYVREAQSAAGLQRPVLRSIAWLVLIWPVLCVRLQRELNRLWQAEGVRVGR